MQPLVSVIVCAYNAVETISRCLDSIMGQSLEAFELIIIDDGSIDGTGSVIDNYAESDGRITVIHQPNQGIAKSRQTGLDNVTGKYTLFVDADDWIEPDMFKVLTEKAEDSSSDIVFCDFYEENEQGCFYRKQEPACEKASEVLPQMLVQLYGVLWNKLIRSDLYIHSGARFIEGLNFCEDECIIIHLLSVGCKVNYVGQALYHYDKKSNPASFTNQWDRRPVEEYELFIRSCAPYLDTPPLKRNLDERIAGIIKKLTYAPRDCYSATRAFYSRYRASLWRSGMSLPRKLYCVLYYNGLRCINKFGRAHVVK